MIHNEERQLGEFDTRRTYKKKSKKDRKKLQETILFKWMAEQEVGLILGRKTFPRSTKDRKSWRAMITSPSPS